MLRAPVHHEAFLFLRETREDELKDDSPAKQLEVDPPQKTKQGNAKTEAYKWLANQAANYHYCKVRCPCLHQVILAQKMDAMRSTRIITGMVTGIAPNKTYASVRTMPMRAKLVRS